MRAVPLILGLVAGCGRIGFDPGNPAGARCADRYEPNNTPANATPLALGATIDATLCPGDVDVYAVTLAAGDELTTAIVPGGAGWPTLEIRGQTERAVATLESSSSAFADRDGTYYITVSGVAAADGTPYHLSAALRAGHHVFVAPDGLDSNPGTFAQPWQRLDTAIARLVPGDVLVLEDGRYASANGALDVNCAGGAALGTEAQPIRIAALSERVAEVDADGSRTAAVIRGGCAWWTIEGLHLENADLAGSSSGGGLTIEASDHITARRLLIAHNNRWLNSHLLEVYNASNVLVEDCEVYDFHRDGIAVGNGNDITVRRSFAASRGRADLPGAGSGTGVPYASDPADKGDSGFAVSGTARALFENNIEEGNGAFGVDDGYGSDLTDTRLLGNVTRNDDYGVLSSVFDTTTFHNVRTQLADHVSIGATYEGFFIRSSEQASCRGCTAIGSGDSGWMADVISSNQRPASSSCTACLAVGNAHYGFDVSTQPAGWTITTSNAFGNGTDFHPTGVAELVAPIEVDPQLGGCLVYVPDSSPMRAASNGGDIGAQIAFRYRDGTLSGVPLWDPTTGVFPCGAVIAGVNDDPATSCIGVHERLHVGTPDCALPFPAP